MQCNLLSDVRLFTGHVEFRLYVCQHDIQKRTFLSWSRQLRSGMSVVLAFIILHNPFRAFRRGADGYPPLPNAENPEKRHIFQHCRIKSVLLGFVVCQRLSNIYKTTVSNHGYSKGGNIKN